LLKLSFLASLLLNFSTISLDMLLKFINKSAQKILIFPSKASYARGLFLIFYYHFYHFIVLTLDFPLK
ncbi:MAG: hypothetical protein ACXVAJ_07955, partial [Parachlamydiaceae bacterium]